MFQELINTNITSCMVPTTSLSLKTLTTTITSSSIQATTSTTPTAKCTTSNSSLPRTLLLKDLP